MIGIPEELKVIGCLVVWVWVLLILASLLEWRAERRRAVRAQRTDGETVEWADVERALRGGCCVTADAIPDHEAEAMAEFYGCGNPRHTHHTCEGAEFCLRMRTRETAPASS